MSVTWETQMERELEERYSEWRERQVMEQLNDYGIDFMPEDKSYRAYKKPGMYQTPKDATTHLLAMFGIGGVLLALFICGVNYVSKVVAR